MEKSSVKRVTSQGQMKKSSEKQDHPFSIFNNLLVPSKRREYRLKEIKECSSDAKREELQAQDDAHYGRDPNCLDWKPVDHLKEKEGLYPVPHTKSPPWIMEMDVKHMKYLMHFKLHFFMTSFLNVQGNPPITIPEALFYPDCGVIKDPRDVVDVIAIFRAKVSKQHYHSVRDFWEEFEEAYDELCPFGYDPPSYKLFYSLEELYDRMKEAGDEFGMKMAAILKLVQYDHADYTWRTYMKMQWFRDDMSPC